VSRPVVRQALARLKAENRLNSRKGSGHYVQEMTNTAVGYSFGTLRSVPDIRLFLEFRCFLESEIASLAAKKGDVDAIAEVERRNQLLKVAIETGQPAIQEDIDFHFAIAQASGNRFFISTLSALGQQTQTSIRLIRDSLIARWLSVSLTSIWSTNASLIASRRLMLMALVLR
jgi:DNA-binding FadR family transcriptional regulator